MGYHLTEAGERLETAKILLENRRSKDAISRAYYCMYHAAKAILLTKDLSPRTHKGLIQKFGEEFIRTEKISKEYSSMLSKAEDLREHADYDVVREFTMEEAEAVVMDAEKFLERIREFLKEE
ncbi:MAG: HEPN domain-containing protein [Candidatus Hydrothermarchaeales archaeon]